MPPARSRLSACSAVPRTAGPSSFSAFATVHPLLDGRHPARLGVAAVAGTRTDGTKTFFVARSFGLFLLLKTV